MADWFEDIDHHNDDDLSDDSASVMSDSDGNAFHQNALDDARRCDHPLIIQHKFIHWIRNEDDPISILLTGTWHQNSPLSMLQGLEDSVLENIVTFAVSPCNCCHDGPIAFCCRRQKKCLIDKDKKLRPVLEGEVPDKFFLSHNILTYEEGLAPAEIYYGLVENGTTMRLSDMACLAKYGTYLVVTNTGIFYNYYSVLDYKSDDDIAFINVLQERMFRFEWNRSTHVKVTTDENDGRFIVKFIKFMEKELNFPNPAYVWREFYISLPFARIQELSDLIQEKQ